eukprot:4189005-Pyramimonas_sp.AAC.1
MGEVARGGLEEERKELMQDFVPERFRDARLAKIQRLVQSWAPRNRKMALAGIRAPDGSHFPSLE